jgi:thymidine phosphorylase
VTAPATMAEVIRAKRDGAALGEEDIGRLIAGIVDGSVSDAQVAAFAMAATSAACHWPSARGSRAP